MNITLFNKEIVIDKKKLVIIIAVPITVIILGVFGFMKLHSNSTVFIGKEIDEKATKSIDAASTVMTDEAVKPTEKPIIQDEIKIYIVGCVKKEGIVTIKKGQIIFDAIELAGGLTKEADLRSINMAYVLTENVMLKVKSKAEIQDENQNLTKPQSQPKTPETIKGIEIVKDSGGAISNDSKKVEKKSGKININTASNEELDTLPRVGEKTANDIIDYREKIGGFKKIEDIMEVPRIGEKTFADLKDLIDVK